MYIMVDSLVEAYNKLMAIKKDLEQEIDELEEEIKKCKDYMRASELREEIKEDRLRIKMIDDQTKGISDYLGIHEIDIEEDTDYNRGSK